MWYISKLQVFFIVLGQRAECEFFTRRTRMLTFSGLSWESDYRPRRYLAPLQLDLFQLYVTALHWHREIYIFSLLFYFSCPMIFLLEEILVLLMHIFGFGSIGNPLQRYQGLCFGYTSGVQRFSYLVNYLTITYWCFTYL